MLMLISRSLLIFSNLYDNPHCLCGLFLFYSYIICIFAKKLYFDMCERCDKIKEFTIQDYTTFGNSNAWIVIEENIFLFYIRHGNYVLKYPIKFCPFCGKELVFKPEPTTLDDITNIFDYLRLLDTFTERNGPEYEKWRYASDYVMKHHDDKNCQEMIKHIEKKFKKNEGNEF